MYKLYFYRKSCVFYKHTLIQNKNKPSHLKQNFMHAKDES